MYYEGVELIVPVLSTANQINFPDIPELRSDSEKDIIITSIRVHNSDSVPFSFANNPVASATQIGQAFLTLYILGSERFFRVPLIEFMSTYSTTASRQWSDRIFETENLRVDWTKSYLTFPVALANPAQLCYLFSFGYQKLPPGTYAKWLNVRVQNWQQGVIKG